MRTPFFLFLFLGLSGPLLSQTVPEKELDSLMGKLDAHDVWMGSAAISMKGELAYENAIGHRRISPEDSLAFTPETRSRIGSVTKMFTATMILQLIEEGKLSYSTPLSKFYPGIPNADSITIDRMLQHRSGLHNFTNDSAYRDYMEKELSQKDMLKKIRRMEPDTVPGARTAYSNTNFVLLGYILEKITGKSYGKVLQERIGDPLELENTAFGDGVDPSKNEALSYRKKSKGWKKATETYMGIPHGAGAIVSTASDLTRFADALFYGKLLDSSSLKKMKATRGDPLGRGIFVMPYKDKTGYGHSGSIDAYTAVLMHLPKDSISVALASNGANFSNQNLLRGILAHVYGGDYQVPSFKTTTIPSEKLDRYPGKYRSDSIAMKISIEKKDDGISAQATGQPSFPLTPSSETEFHFRKAGVTIRFRKLEKGKYQKLILDQAGRKFEFVRK